MSEGMQQVYPDEEAQMCKDSGQGQSDAEDRVSRFQRERNEARQQLAKARSILERTRYFVARYSREHVALDGPFQCLHQIDDWLAANPE